MVSNAGRRNNRREGRRTEKRLNREPPVKSWPSRTSPRLSIIEKIQFRRAETDPRLKFSIETYRLHHGERHREYFYDSRLTRGEGGSHLSKIFTSLLKISLTQNIGEFNETR